MNYSVVETNEIDRRQELTATEGDSVQLPCPTKVSAPVFWRYQINITYMTSYISGQGHVYSQYTPRMELNETTRSLTIRNVTVNDTGLYSCVDDDGFGQIHYTQLTVEVKNLTETSATDGSDDTSMTTSHIILIVVLVSAILIAVAAIVVFIVVKYFKDAKSRPNEVTEMIPLRANQHDVDIKRLSGQLKEIIEPDYGLLDQLVSLGVLTRREYHEVDEEQTVYRKLDRLLNLLTTEKSEEQCRKLLLALTKTDQQHVVNYIQQQQQQQRGAIDGHFGDVQPLDEDQQLYLVVNAPSLIKLIDSNDAFLTDLAASGCITQEHEISLRTTHDQLKRNRKLLEILRRRSVVHLKKFAECLTNSNQMQAAVILQKGVLVTMDATLDARCVDDVSEAENQIVSRFASTLSVCDGSMKPQVMSLLEEQFKAFLQTCDVDIRGKLLSMLSEFQEKITSLGQGAELVLLKKQNSVDSFFFCQTHQSMERLKELYDKGELRQTLELVFTLLLRSTERVCVKRLQWLENDYGLYVNYFKTRGSSMIVEGIINQFQFPMEVLEMLLVKMFVAIFIDYLRTDGLYASDAELLAYRTLSSVCSDWWQTLNGWPQSNTKHWVRHRLQRHVTFLCRPYRRHPQLVKQFNTKKNVFGVTQLDDTVFVVCQESDTIQVFGLNYEQLEQIKVKELKQPTDIVACRETRSLYVADWQFNDSLGCVWRVSVDRRVIKFLTATPMFRPSELPPMSPTTKSSFRPRSLSLTSGRLLLTTRNELLLYGADEVELNHLSFTDMSELQHAVETSHGTFVFCHLDPQRQIVEVDADGRIISVFNDQKQLAFPCYLSMDSEGRMFIADANRRHILLLTSDFQFDRVLLDIEHNQLARKPDQVIYVEQTRQLIVACEGSPVVQVFAVG